MVRTKADAARKAGGKASRKTPVSSGSSTSAYKSGGKKGRQGSGNSYRPCAAPSWQIPINKFFGKSTAESAAGSAADLDPPLESVELVDAPSSSIDLNGAEPSTSHDSIESSKEDDLMNEETSTGSAADLDPPLESAKLVDAPSSSINLNGAEPSTSHDSIDSSNEDDLMNGEGAADSDEDLDPHQESAHLVKEPSSVDLNGAGPSTSHDSIDSSNEDDLMNGESAAGSAADLDPPLESAKLVDAPSSSIDLNGAEPSTNHDSIDSSNEDDLMNGESAADSDEDLDPHQESAHLVKEPSSVDLNGAGPSANHESPEKQ